MAGEVYQVTTPGPVSLRNAPVCDAAQVVLGMELSLDFTCSAGGMVSLEFPSGDPSRLLTGFVRALRAQGLRVDMGLPITITGDQEGHATAGEGRAPSGVPASSEGGTWFSVDLDADAASAVLDAVAVTPATVVELLPVAAYFDEATRAVASLGLDVRLARVGGRVLAAGEVSEVGLLASVLGDFEELTTYVVTAVPPTEVMSGLLARYPGLSLEWQSDLTRVAVQGPREAAIEAATAIRALSVPVTPVRVTVTFVSYDVRDISDQEIEAVFSLGDSTASLFGGSGVLDGATFQARLTDLVSQEVISVERHPAIATVSGRTARFVSGSSVPVVAGVNEDGFQEVDYRDTGVVLEVLPTLHQGGTLSLFLSAEISSSDGLGDTPTFSTREVETTVLVQSGDVVGVSGLEQSTDALTRTRAFRIFPGRASESATSRLAFFVTANYLP